ncbi:MAG: class SAM-dependent methyltransferase [Thermoleophilia bacterium]|nr:class SAM-dependent methyltransferase [Thermoleophilia bacterium]
MTNLDPDEHQGHAAHAHGHGHGRHGGDATWSPAELAGFLAGTARPVRQAVDIGCGAGADAVFLAEQGIETTGVDVSADALERARGRAEAHGVQVTWLEADVLALPLQDASVDLVLDRGCLHHVRAADHPSYAAQVARVLRPGGVLLVRDMVRPGHDGPSVSEQSVRAMLTELPLRVASVTTYAAPSGHTALLVAVERT